MAWLTCDEDGQETIFGSTPDRCCSKLIGGYWDSWSDDYINLPKGSIKKLIGRELSWSDEPVELK